MKSVRTIVLVAGLVLPALSLLLTGCEKAPAPAKPASTPGPATPDPKPAPAPSVPAAAAPSAMDHHDHAHGEELGTITIAAWTVKVSGSIEAGKEAHVDIALSGSTEKPAAVRVWVGSQDGKGAMKEKADGDGKEYHAHAAVPNPIPATAKFWIEIEDTKGNKTSGGIAIK